MRALIALALLFVSGGTAISQEQFQTTLNCQYEETNSFFGDTISFSLFQSSKGLSAIYEYPVRDGTQIDAKLASIPGKLSFDILHISDVGTEQIDRHEVDIKSKQIISSITKGGSSQAAGYCQVSFDLPESDEKCSYWQADTDIARGGRICVSDHLPAYKANTYGATSLMREGAWCDVLEDGQPTKASLTYYGYDIFAGSPTYARLGISNGYDKSDAVFNKNARAKTIIVTSGNFFQEAFVLKDTMVEQYLDFGELLKFEELEVEIIDTYPGSAFEHVCVSSVFADFEYDPEYGDLFEGEIYADKISVKEALAIKNGPNKTSSVEVAPANSNPIFTEAEPKPTQGIKSADRPKPLTIEQYKVHFGWPEKFADYQIQTSPQLRFAIIDNGFQGLEDYLDTRPDLKKRVTYVDLGGKSEAPDDNHGFNVFQIADHVMPTGEILLLDIALGNRDFFEEAVDEMNNRGFYYGTMSIGTFGEFDRTTLTDQLPEFLQKLENSQTTLFVSAGNYRDDIHTAFPSDVDDDGKIEFWPNEGSDKARENLVFGVAANRETYLELGWGDRPNAQGSVTATLYRNDQVIKVDTFKEARGFGIFTIDPPLNNTGYRLEVEFKNLSGPLPLLRIRRNSTSRYGTPWNGLRSNGDYAIWDSPFLIPVGSVGEIDGKLSPSVFSSIDMSNEGKVQPLIYGPGQLNLNGETFNGTSYSTPFIAALYSAFGTFNIRNYIEQTTSFKPFLDGLSVSEVSRWGTPDYRKMLAVGGNVCLEKKAELLDAKVENGRISAKLKISRNCMEKTKYGVTMRLETVEPNADTGYIENVTATVNGQSVIYAISQYRKSENKAIIDEVIEFNGIFDPIDARFKGKMVRPHFQLFTQLDQQGSSLFLSEEAFLLGE
ncbi:NADase-type glycan-binding domain-containing protein [Maritalea sp.]|jgi:hypothetical protein|uniref:NADase-type glycan-binding domain-containing protein n=1 Tax=Maritalea sp. TaxID=2003361 RepID=UPI0039E61458